MRYHRSDMTRGRGALNRTALVVIALAAACQPAEAQIAERTEVHVRVVQVRVDPAAWVEPGRCHSLDANDFRVRLRGRELPRERIVEIERDDSPALHAILVDTSRSMAGLLGRVREAASNYTRTVFARGDQGFVLDFGSVVTLSSPRSGDAATLAASLDSLRVGKATALYDALIAAASELDDPSIRPVVLVVTDGVDSASRADAEAVFAAFEALPRASVFVVGLGIPQIGFRGGATPKKFLQHLAAQTNGRFFDVPTGSRIDGVFRRVAEALSNSWTIAVVDDAPDRPGRLVVETVVPGCEAHVVSLDPISEAPPQEFRADGVIAIPPPTAWHGPMGLETLSTDARCDAEGSVRLDGTLAIGCAIDLTTDEGTLYSSDDVEREWYNAWPAARLRPFVVQLAPADELPASPVETLDRILPALRALGDEVEIGTRQRPRSDHARPFHDVGVLWNGWSWLEFRRALALALAQREDYRSSVDRGLAAEADRALESLRERVRKAAPELASERIDEIARTSPAGQAIVERAARPGARDLARFLGAWLGDVSAADLLAAWEARAITASLAGERGADLAADYEALRRLFFVPSYARVLVPLVPGRDPTLGRIGFWRIVLPRSEHMLWRVKGWKGNDEVGNLPFDLVPPRPLGILAIESRARADPDSIARLRREGFTANAVRYEPLGPPYRRDPVHAFDHVRVTVEFKNGSERMTIVEVVGPPERRERPRPSR